MVFSCPAPVSLCYIHTSAHKSIHRCQDNGWCFSYTCLKRLMSFWSVISMQQDYTMHFSGSNPQKLRFSLLDSNPELVTILKIFYPKSSRLLVRMSLYMCMDIFVCFVPYTYMSMCLSRDLLPQVVQAFGTICVHVYTMFGK